MAHGFLAWCIFLFLLFCFHLFFVCSAISLVISGAPFCMFFLGGIRVATEHIGRQTGNCKNSVPP